MLTKRRIRLVLTVFLGVSALGILGFLIWAGFPPAVEQPARLALGSVDASRLATGTALVFSPPGGISEVGLILYPGGRVRPEAYAPLAAELADQGFLTVVPRMTLNLAVFEIKAADPVIRAYPEVDSWVIGGHSLGGAMAAEYTAEHAEQVAGLILLASYPAESTDLSSLTVDVLSVYGDRDGLAAPAEVLSSKDRLPETTIFEEIEGGNHAGFAWYGPQRGDLPAEIRKQDQQAEIQNIMVNFLSRIGGDNGQ